MRNNTGAGLVDHAAPLVLVTRKPQLQRLHVLAVVLGIVRPQVERHDLCRVGTRFDLLALTTKSHDILMHFLWLKKQRISNNEPRTFVQEYIYIISCFCLKSVHNRNKRHIKLKNLLGPPDAFWHYTCDLPPHNIFEIPSFADERDIHRQLLHKLLEGTTRLLGR